MRKVDAAVATRWMVKLGVAKEGVAEKLGMESGVFVIVVTGLDEQRQAETNKANKTKQNRSVILYPAGLKESKHAA